MTRDEAIKALVTALPKMSEAYYGQLVDAFVALGMLELDEPKKEPMRQLMERMNTATHPSHIPGMLNELGLKIVEK